MQPLDEPNLTRYSQVSAVPTYVGRQRPGRRVLTCCVLLQVHYLVHGRIGDFVVNAPMVSASVIALRWLTPSDILPRRFSVMSPQVSYQRVSLSMSSLITAHVAGCSGQKGEARSAG